MRPSEASLENFVGRLQTEQKDGGDDDDDEEEDRGQPTQITMNPSELLDQLNQQVARNTGSGQIKSITPVPHGSQTGTGGPAPLPAPPKGPPKGPAKGPPKPVVGAKQSGKFPDLPNLPTVVAPDAEPQMKPSLTSGPLSSIGPAQPDPAQAPTAIGAPIISEAAIKKTELAMDAQSPPPGLDMAGGPMSSTPYAVRPGSMQHAQNQTQPENAVYDPAAASGPYAQAPNTGPTGYPVMPGGQRPFSSDLAPSHTGSPQRSSYAGQSFDSSSAAGLMSPVGEQYPQTDWEQAAAMQATALPPWKLAMLFVLVVGGALAITLVVAKAFV
jgi:hypothetical protein